jgi:pimeloyl-ACP methyl ester carboxylesterase
MIAQHCALRYPDRFASLAILDSSAQFGNGGAVTSGTWLTSMIAAIDATPLSTFTGEMVRSITGPGLSPEGTAECLEAISRATKPGLRLAARIIANHDAALALPTLRLPTVVIAGELDTETPVEYSKTLVQLIPRAELTVIPDCGHLSNVEAPDAVNSTLRSHLIENAQ